MVETPKAPSPTHRRQNHSDAITRERTLACAVTSRKGPLRFWASWLVPPVVVLIVLFGVRITRNGDLADPYLTWKVGRVLTRVAEADPGLPFQNLTQLALVHDESGFYALDSFAGRIHRLDLEGTVLASMGSLGEGPGEMGMPTAIRAVEDGVWALDSGNARAVLFGPDGQVLKTLAFDENPATIFAPMAGGLVVPGLVSPIPGDTGAPLLAHVTEEGVRAIATDGVEIPDVLANSGFLDRVQGWMLAPVAGHEVALLLNGSVLEGWRLALSHDYREIAEIESISIPESIVDLVRDVEVPEPDLRLRPLGGVRTVGGDLWVMTNGLGPDLFGFTAPRGSSDNRVTLVYPGVLADEWVMDAIVLFDRVVAITPTEILILGAHPCAYWHGEDAMSCSSVPQPE